MSIESLHLFDLDYTLWKMPNKLAVIDKNNPTEIIHRISNSEIPFMKSMYKKYDLEVNYNGETWYLNNEMWDLISKKLNKNSSIEDVGISNRELTNEELLEDQVSRTIYLLDNVKNLKNEKCEVGILTARMEKNKHIDNLNILKDKISLYVKKPITKVYFINDIDKNFNDDKTSVRKANIILEHLVGYKVKNNKFVNLDQTSYYNVTFYDDNTKNIEMVQNLQFLLEKYLLNTDQEIKNKILDRVKNNMLEYVVNKITTNKENPVITYSNILASPHNIKLYKEY